MEGRKEGGDREVVYRGIQVGLEEVVIVGSNSSISSFTSHTRPESRHRPRKLCRF